MPNIGVPELLIVLVIAVLILGPKRIPAAAKSVGQGIRGFRSSLGGDDDEPKDRDRIEEQTTAEAKPADAKVDEQTKTGA
mgnify:CR=1 FL=1